MKDIEKMSCTENERIDKVKKLNNPGAFLAVHSHVF